MRNWERPSKWNEKWTKSCNVEKEITTKRQSYMRNRLKIPLQSRKVTLEINTNLKVGPEIKTNPQSEKKWWKVAKLQKQSVQGCKVALEINTNLKGDPRIKTNPHSWMQKWRKVANLLKKSVQSSKVTLETNTNLKVEPGIKTNPQSWLRNE